VLTFAKGKDEQVPHIFRTLSDESPYANGSALVTGGLVSVQTHAQDAGGHGPSDLQAKCYPYFPRQILDSPTTPDQAAPAAVKLTLQGSGFYANGAVPNATKGTNYQVYWEQYGGGANPYSITQYLFSGT
jgi:hypothetical protein